MSSPEFPLFVASEALYALAFAACLAGAIYARPRLGTAGMALASLGFAANAAFLIARWAAQGHAPIVSLFELVSGGTLFAVAILLGLHFIRRVPAASGIAGSAVLAVAFLGMGASFFVNPALSTMSPALRSYWLYIHVFFALAAYGCFLVAAGAGLTWLVKARRAGADAGALDSLDRLVHRSVTLGFVTTTVFIAAGAVWARYAWGRYWGWDPVETASLCTWVVYGLYLHLWLRRGWRGRKAAWMAVGAFPLVLVCFWILPFVTPATQHLYETM